MVKNYVIKEPFFEYGPKCYMYGDTLLEIAKGLDELAEKYDVDVILDVPDTEIFNIAHNVKRVHVYSQHMDSLAVGKGMGRTLPEALWQPCRSEPSRSCSHPYGLGYGPHH